MRNPARSFWLLCISAGLVLVGCKSLPEKIDQLTQAGEFGEARALLEEKGAGTIVGAEVSHEKEEGAEALSARRIFMERVEATHGGRARAALDAGNSRSGLRLAEEAFDLCPWSSNLRALREQARANCAKLDQILTEHAKLPAEDVEQSRSFVRRWRSLLPLAGDDVAVRQALRARSELVSAHEAALFLAAGMRDDQAAASRSIAALGELDVPPILLKSVREGASIILALPSASKAEKASAVFTSLEQADDARCSLGSDKIVAGFADAFAKISIEWSRREVAGYVDKFAATDGAFVEGMERIRQERSLFAESLAPHLARAHALRATRLAPMGPAASAALAHRLRALELGWSEPSEELRRLAEATLAKRANRRYTVSITSDGAADVEVLGQIFLATTIGLRVSSQDDVIWVPVAPEQGNVDAVVHLSFAQRLVPSSRDLTPVNSQHFSHMQTVPNPRKAALKAQLAGAEVAVNIAQGSYRSAVSSFNIYPNQYSLNSANYAENNYRAAVNNYNSLVSIYNSTPSTMEQPVYLPYTYFQGTMRCGYRVEGRMTAGGRDVRFGSDKFDTHFVRINTKYSDTNPSSRSDVYYPRVDIGDRLMGHLVAVSLEIAQSIKGVPMLPEDSFLDDLSPGELACVAFVLHPLQEPSASALGVPQWAASTIDKARFKTGRAEPPALAVAGFDLSPHLTGSLEDKLPVLRELTCKIECRTPFQASHGSGSLISGDGLVLTAAHVVQGSSNRILIEHGPHAGGYDAEVLFVDDRADVAILRAKNLRPARWFPVRLEGEVASGSSVLAIGYPAVADKSGGDVQTVTAGIVSSVRPDGSLIADLTVASGNSGGPIIDAKTGEIIGVVSAVISPGVDKNFASSGFWCRGFAAPNLRKSLGLQPAK
jgi:S1-C subfamily serine protease